MGSNLVQVEVTGTDHIVERLMGFNKEAYRILQSDIRASVSSMQKDARAAVPDPALSNWGPWMRGGRGSGGFRNTTSDRNYSGSEVSGSIKTSVRARKFGGASTRGVVGFVRMGSGAGAIFTMAGKRNASGEWFNINLNRKYGTGPWPRIMGPAWTANIDKARESVKEAMYRAAEAVTRG